MGEVGRVGWEGKRVGAPDRVSDQHHANADRLAAILVPSSDGGAVAVEVGAAWRVADTDCSDIGETVGADILDQPATGVVRGAVAWLAWAPLLVG